MFRFGFTRLIDLFNRRASRHARLGDGSPVHADAVIAPAIDGHQDEAWLVCWGCGRKLLTVEDGTALSTMRFAERLHHLTFDEPDAVEAIIRALLAASTDGDEQRDAIYEAAVTAGFLWRCPTCGHDGFDSSSICEECQAPRSGWGTVEGLDAGVWYAPIYADPRDPNVWAKVSATELIADRPGSVRVRHADPNSAASAVLAADELVYVRQHPV